MALQLRRTSQSIRMPSAREEDERQKRSIVVQRGAARAGGRAGVRPTAARVLRRAGSTRRAQREEGSHT